MKVSIKDFLEQCLFNDGRFCRIDIPIRVMAVEDYSKSREINNIWWRMQYAKLWYHWGKAQTSCKDYPQMIKNQMCRMTTMVASFDYGTFPVLPLTVGSNFALKDGSHRLSCHIYYGTERIPLEVLKKPYYKPVGIDENIKMLYSKKEWTTIIEYKNNLLKSYGLL